MRNRLFNIDVIWAVRVRFFFILCKIIFLYSILCIIQVLLKNGQFHFFRYTKWQRVLVNALSPLCIKSAFCQSFFCGRWTLLSASLSVYDVCQIVQAKGSHRMQRHHDQLFITDCPATLNTIFFEVAFNWPTLKDQDT